MPKIFTDEEKEGHRAILLDQGLGLIMKNGYKNVTIDQLVQLIGASKGYFYVLFQGAVFSASHRQSDGKAF